MPEGFVTMSIAASTLHFSEDDGGFFQVAVCWDASLRSTGGALRRAAAHSCAEWRPVRAHCCGGSRSVVPYFGISLIPYAPCYCSNGSCLFVTLLSDNSD